MNGRSPLEIGDAVSVPWGVETIAGTIVSIYGPSGHQFALVRIWVLGANGEVLEENEVSMPLSALTSAA